MTTIIDTPSYVQILKTIGIPGIVPGSKDYVDGGELMTIAELNKIALLFSDSANIEQHNGKDLRAQHELFIETLQEVSSTLKKNGINYSVFKTIKPFPTTPSDVDVLLSKEDFREVEDLLITLGYKKTASDAYGSTLEKKMIVDLQMQPSVSNMPYLPKTLLMQNTIMKKIGSFDVSTLNPEAELIVIATHSFYKEQMFTLNDYYTITMLAEQVDPVKLLNMARTAKVLEVLRIVVGLCSQITESVFNTQLKISELSRVVDAPDDHHIQVMPLRFPFSMVIKYLISRATKDREMRRRVVPAMIRIASPSQLAKLFSHITRHTY